MAMKIRENSLIWRHRQAGEKARALAVAHRAHDRHDDQRIADQHEQRQHHRRRDVAAQERRGRGVAPSAMKKNSNRKSRRRVSRAAIASRNGVEAERHAREQASHFLTEAEASPSAASIAAQRDGEDTRSSGERASRTVGGRRHSGRTARPTRTARRADPAS